MTLTTTDSWPPADYTVPLPEDPRGCCWPWGPCGRVLRLETRLLLVGERAGGPVGAGWQDVATGMLAGIDVAISSFLSASYFETPGAPPFSIALEVYSNELAEGPWFGDLAINTGPPNFGQLFAEGEMASATCLAGDLLLVTFTAGPPQPPDFIRVKWLRWYQLSPYP